MGLDGADAEKERRGDLAVGLANGEEAKDLVLAPGQGAGRRHRRRGASARLGDRLL